MNLFQQIHLTLYLCLRVIIEYDSLSFFQISQIVVSFHTSLIDELLEELLGGCKVQLRHITDRIYKVLACLAVKVEFLNRRHGLFLIHSYVEQPQSSFRHLLGSVNVLRKNHQIVLFSAGQSLYHIVTKYKVDDAGIH